MRIRSLLLAFLAVAAIFAPEAPAQEEEEETQPNLVVLRYFACDLGQTGAAVQILNGAWRDVMEDLKDEGMIQGYGILTHAWGDEWNLMDWFSVENMHAFHEAWSEATRRIGEWAEANDPEGEGLAKFTKVCKSHKDNVYQIVHRQEKEAEAEGS
jgi:hypothetical protein